MRLPSFLTRRPSSTAEPASTTPADAVQRARTQARQRLIGASILLGLGIVGFPLLFETQPRPVPVDIPIEIPSKDAALPAPVLPAARRASQPPAAAQGPRSAPLPALASVEPAPTAAAPTPAAASAPVSPALPARPAAASAPARPRPPAVAASVPARPAAAASAPAESGRFVVQVGAFADASGARETRLKAEKLGLKTYTQTVQVQGSERIRVRLGPFASRADAERALAKLKAAGLGGAVLTL